jgi:hypothetical protein
MENQSQPWESVGYRRRLFSEFLKDIEWPVLIILGLVSLTLGTLGYHEYYVALRRCVECVFGAADYTYHWVDYFFQSIQLFYIETNGVYGVYSLPWKLQVARFLSPTLAAYAFFKALAIIFRQEIRLFLINLTSGHVIICGLGRKGYFVTREFRQRNQRVVIIERDPENPLIPPCEDMGATVIIGDARDPVFLKKAGIHRASQLIAVCDEDDTNSEIAIQARELAGSNRQELLCTVHVHNAELWTQLRNPKYTLDPGSPVQIGYFNIFESGARLILREHPPFPQNPPPNARPHFLVVGLGYLGECLLVHAARNWCQYYDLHHQPLRVTIVDPHVNELMQVIYQRYPLVSEVCQVTACAFDSRDPQFLAGNFLFDQNKICDLSHIYICLDNSYDGLTAGLAIMRHLHNHEAEIIVRMTENSGQARLLKEARDYGENLTRFSTFALFENTCKPERFDDGTREILAEAIHNAYLEEQQEKGIELRAKNSMVPWEELPEDFKSSNRDQAYHISDILAAAGYGIAPWNEKRIDPVQFTPEELELMAEAEHQRWCKERLRRGWKLGVKWDFKRKTSPALIPWKVLPEDERAKDRETVLRIPAYLKRVRFRLYKVNIARHTSASHA